jgi:hypothetical protein
MRKGAGGGRGVVGVDADVYIISVRYTVQYIARYTGIQEFPNLNRCAKAGMYQRMSKLLTSRPIHKTNRVSTHTLENDRCK